ncbi:hypothetical protein AM420_003153 [Klebsiella pneumoniae]|nr:hypothetical protein AM420_002531 [Klebsiella pneumoniae]OKN55106.1 hypothetical protein AM420_003153 [Klebsiella pneumoniae]
MGCQGMLVGSYLMPVAIIESQYVYQSRSVPHDN